MDLTEQEILIFRNKGFLHLKNIFSEDICTNLLEELKNLKSEDIFKSNFGRHTFMKRSKKNNIKSENFNGLTYLQRADLFCPSIRRIMSLKLLSIGGKLLNRDDCFFADNEIHIRQPNLENIIPSHQDNFYFRFKKPKALTCYVYITNQNRKTGGLGFLEQKINSSIEPHQRSSKIGFSSYVEEKEKLAEQFIYPNTNKGDVIFHHCTTFHRADSNLGNMPSLAASIRIFSSGCMDLSKELHESYINNLNYNRDKYESYSS